MNRDGVFNFLSSILVIIAGLAIGFFILLVSDSARVFPAVAEIIVGLAIGLAILLVSRRSQKTSAILVMIVGLLIGLVLLLISGSHILPAVLAILARLVIGLAILFISPYVGRRTQVVLVALIMIAGLAIGIAILFMSGSAQIALAVFVVIIGFVIGFFIFRSGSAQVALAAFVMIAGFAIGVFTLLSDSAQAVPAFLTILTFGAGSMRNIGDVLLFATPIILTGLSVAFAYKTGLFNIGATGQFTFGAFVAIYIGVNFDFLPPPIRIITSIVAAAIAGALWGAIPGLLKAYRNVHEVISCIMTNYIGMYLVNHMIVNHLFDQGRGTTMHMLEDSNLPSLGMENIFSETVGNLTRSSNVNLGIIIAIVMAILVYIILEKTTFGYGLKACGFNRDAAKYAGINEKSKIVSSMMICGALAGIGGALNFMNGTGLSLSAVDMLQPEGFTGISVAFLGLNHPIGIIFSGTLVSYLFLGGARIQVYGFSVELMEIVISVIIYFCAFVFLVKSFLGRRRGRPDKEPDGQDAAEEEETA